MAKGEKHRERYACKEDARGPAVVEREKAGGKERKDT